jgi:hypothetical protein
VMLDDGERMTITVSGTPYELCSDQPLRILFGRSVEANQ